MPSRFAAKVFANGFFAVIAIAFFISFVASDRRDSTLNAIQNFWVTSYMEAQKVDARAALAQEQETGNTEVLVRLLESSRWRESRSGDRAYSLKRKMLSRLCINLQQQGDYEQLIKWSDVWLSTNDRDLDARAFWFEGIRHIPERESEGFEGLIANYHDFPKNIYLQRFLAAAYLDREDTDAAAKIVGSMVDQVLSDWQIFWTTSDLNFFSESRSTHITLSRSDGSEVILHFDLPGNAATVRIDLPPMSHVRIHNLQSDIGEARQEVALNEVKLSQMRYERETLVAYGEKDPYFVLPVERGREADPDTPIAVTLRLQISAVILGREFSLTELFDDT
tara:strand:+ start:903 stop:1910 length:1008 start_codon:yes stop_codon:yes gene_type:complete